MSRYTDDSTGDDELIQVRAELSQVVREKQALTAQVQRLQDDLEASARRPVTPDNGQIQRRSSKFLIPASGGPRRASRVGFDHAEHIHIQTMAATESTGSSMPMCESVSSATSVGRESCILRRNHGRRTSSWDGVLADYQEHEARMKERIQFLEAQLDVLHDSGHHRRESVASFAGPRSRASSAAAPRRHARDREDSTDMDEALVVAEMGVESLRNEVRRLMDELHEVHDEKLEAERVRAERERELQGKVDASKAQCKALLEELAVAKAATMGNQARLEEASYEMEELRELLASSRRLSADHGPGMGQKRSIHTKFGASLFDELDNDDNSHSEDDAEEEETDLPTDLQKENLELKRELSKAKEKLESVIVSQTISKLEEEPKRSAAPVPAAPDSDIGPVASRGQLLRAATTLQAKFRARQAHAKVQHLKHKGTLGKLRDGIEQVDLHFKELLAGADFVGSKWNDGIANVAALKKLNGRALEAVQHLEKVRALAVASKERFANGAKEIGDNERPRAARLAEALGQVEAALNQARGQAQGLQEVTAKALQAAESEDSLEVGHWSGRLRTAVVFLSPLHFEASEWAPARTVRDHDLHLITILRHQVAMLEWSQCEARKHPSPKRLEEASMGARLSASELQDLKMSRLGEDLALHEARLGKMRDSEEDHPLTRSAVVGDTGGPFGDTGGPEWLRARMAEVRSELEAERLEKVRLRSAYLDVMRRCKEQEARTSRSYWDSLVTNFSSMMCCRDDRSRTLQDDSGTATVHPPLGSADAGAWKLDGTS